MADLPPGSPIPTPRPSAATRPLPVSIAGWILVVAGSITGFGGLVVLAAGGATTVARPLGAAYVAFGAAELLAGAMVLRLRAAFRVIGVVLAVAGIVVDLGGLVLASSRWQIVAVIGHAFVAYVLATSAEAFRRQG